MQSALRDWEQSSIANKSQTKYRVRAALSWQCSMWRMVSSASVEWSYLRIKENWNTITLQIWILLCSVNNTSPLGHSMLIAFAFCFFFFIQEYKHEKENPSLCWLTNSYVNDTDLYGCFHRMLQPIEFLWICLVNIFQKQIQIANNISGD